MHRQPTLPTQTMSCLASLLGARPVAVGPSGPCSFPADRTRTEATSRRLGRSQLFCLGLILTGLVALAPEPFALAEGAGLDHVRSSGKLRYGSDMEGGGPYAYPDPKSPREVTGFEVELMAMLAKDLGAAPEFCQGQWEMLLQLLDLGQSDIVVNGYEWTEPRARDYLATRPYYVYQLQLMVPRGSPIHTWDDLKQASPGRRPLDGRCTGRFGGRHVHRPGGRQERPGNPVQRFHRRHDRRAKRPVRRDPARRSRGAVLP